MSEKWFLGKKYTLPFICRIWYVRHKKLVYPFQENLGNLYKSLNLAENICNEIGGNILFNYLKVTKSQIFTKKCYLYLKYSTFLPCQGRVYQETIPTIYKMT